MVGICVLLAGCCGFIALDLLGMCAHTPGRLLVFGGLFVAFGLRWLRLCVSDCVICWLGLWLFVTLRVGVVC